MRTLAEQIEDYILSLLRANRHGVVELQRGYLAMRFGCVPSQVSYVLDRRFTVERGFLVESKRGGGGYIRIVRLTMEPEGDGRSHLVRQIGEAISERRADAVIDRLQREGWVTAREGALLRAATRRDVLAVALPLRDQLRARLLKQMLAALWRADAAAGRDAPLPGGDAPVPGRDQPPAERAPARRPAGEGA